MLDVLSAILMTVLVFLVAYFLFRNATHTFLAQWKEEMAKERVAREEERQKETNARKVIFHDFVRPSEDVCHDPSCPGRGRHKCHNLDCAEHT